MKKKLSFQSLAIGMFGLLVLLSPTLVKADYSATCKKANFNQPLYTVAGYGGYNPEILYIYGGTQYGQGVTVKIAGYISSDYIPTGIPVGMGNRSPNGFACLLHGGCIKFIDREYFLSTIRTADVDAPASTYGWYDHIMLTMFEGLPAIGYMAKDEGIYDICSCPYGGDLSGTTCIAPICTPPDGIPANATVFANDEVWLMENTPYTYWPTDTGTRCQYHCNSGYNWNGSGCIAPAAPPAACAPSSGKCGAAKDGTYVFRPTSGLCDGSSVVSGLEADGKNWTWVCEGICGGSDASCNAQRVGYREVAP